MKKKILKLLTKKNHNNRIFHYPLHEDALSKEDLVEGFKVLASRQLTMSKKTKEFEEYFKKKLNLNYVFKIVGASKKEITSLKKLIKNCDIEKNIIFYHTTFWMLTKQ